MIIAIASDPVSVSVGGFIAIVAGSVAVWIGKSIRNAAPFAFRVVDKDAVNEIAKLRIELAAALGREAALKSDNAILRYRLRERGGRHPEGE